MTKYHHEFAGSSGICHAEGALHAAEQLVLCHQAATDYDAAPLAQYRTSSSCKNHSINYPSDSRVESKVPETKAHQRNIDGDKSDKSYLHPHPSVCPDSHNTRWHVVMV